MNNPPQKIENVGFQFGVCTEIWGFPLSVSFGQITSVRFFCFYVLIILYYTPLAEREKE